MMERAEQESPRPRGALPATLPEATFSGLVSSQTRTVGGTFEISFMLPKSSSPADMTNTKRKAKNPSRKVFQPAQKSVH